MDIVTICHCHQSDLHKFIRAECKVYYNIHHKKIPQLKAFLDGTQIRTMSRFVGLEIWKYTRGISDYNHRFISYNLMSHRKRQKVSKCLIETRHATSHLMLHNNKQCKSSTINRTEKTQSYFLSGCNIGPQDTGIDDYISTGRNEK